MILFLKKYWSQLILAFALIFVISFFKGCSNPFSKEDTNDVIKTDTIFRTVVIDAKQGSFTNNNPQPYSTRPIIVNGQNNTELQNYLLRLTETIKTQSAKDRELTQQLVNALAKKEYKEVKEDSIVKVTVNSTVEDGKQTYLGIDYEVKESYFDTYNTVTTIKKYPDYTISAGLGITTQFSKPLEFNNQIIDSLTIPSKVYVNPLIAYKDKKGLEYQLELGIDKDLKIGTASIKLKKDLFTKY